MDQNPDINTCKALLGKIRDPKTKFFWLKLGEQLATLDQPKLAPEPAPEPKINPAKGG